MKKKILILAYCLFFSSMLNAQNLIDANTLSSPPYNSNFKIGVTIRNYEKSKGLGENIYAIQINNKWGVINANWILITPIIFDDVYMFSSGVAQVIYNGKSGLIDTNGAIRIQPKYDEIPFFYTNCPVKDDMLRFHSPSDCDKSFYRIADKWGIIDKNGNEITPAIYSDVPLAFTQSVAVVKKNNKRGMIDSFGNVIIPCIYKKEVSYLHHGYDAVAFIADNGNVGIFNKKGEIIVPFSKRTLVEWVFSDLGAKSTADEVPPVFKVNGKLILAKNIKRLEPDYGIKLDSQTLSIENKNSFIYKYYNSVNTQYSNQPRPQKIASVSENNITDLSDCSEIVKAYEIEVRKNITLMRKIQKNIYVSIHEVSEMDRSIRKWQDIVMKKCAFDQAYRSRVINIMQQLQLGVKSTFPSIKESSPSESSNSTRDKEEKISNFNNQNSKVKENKSVSNNKEETEELGYEELHQTIGCKHCNRTVTVTKNVPKPEKYKKSFNLIGSVVSSMCENCHQTSLFNYEIKDAKFVRIY